MRDKMVILKDLKIHGFRAVKDRSFSPKSINVLIGPNNTGKSSILEAINALISFPSGFKDEIDNSLLDHFKRNEYRPNFLINLAKENAVISGEVKGEKYKATIDYFKQKIPTDERRELILSFFENKLREHLTPIRKKIQRNREERRKERGQHYIKELKKGLASQDLNAEESKELVREIKQQLELETPISTGTEDQIESIFKKLTNDFLEKIRKSSKLIFTLYGGTNQIKGISLYFPEGFRMRTSPDLFSSIDLRRYEFGELRRLRIEGLYKIRPSNLKRVNEIPLGFGFKKLALGSEVNELYESVVSNRKIFEAVNLLSKELPYIEDIRNIRGSLHILSAQKKKPIPLSSMGDGFVALLKIYFLTALCENGIVTLEEPETSQHPTFLNLMARGIVNSSSLVQFFISTHNLELLESILKIAEKKSKLANVNVIRLFRKRGKTDIQIETLTGKTAKEEIDTIGTDLRRA